MTLHLQRSRTTRGYRFGRTGKPQIAVVFEEEDFQWLVRRSEATDRPLAAIVRQAVKLLRLTLPDD